MFLAYRFLGAPDHVLDAESVHAQWKILETNRRGLKSKLLNAMLKLRHYRFTYGGLPPHERLQEELDILSQGRAARYAALVADPAMHPRHRFDLQFRERFQLRAVDVVLARDVDGVGTAAAAAGDGTAETAFANYTRFLFEPNTMYSFTSLQEEGAMKFVYITENKSVARAATKDGLTSGRPLNVVWYEQAPEDAELAEELGPGEILVHPCAGNGVSLPMQEMMIAEMLIAAGYCPQIS